MRRHARVLLAIGLAEAAFLLVAGARWYEAPYIEILALTALDLGWLLCGYAAVRVASASRTGILMMLWACLRLFDDSMGSYGWVGQGLWLDGLATVARFDEYLLIVLALHIAATYPSGQANDSLTRTVVRAVWSVGLVCVVATFVTFKTPDQLTVCATRPCRPNLFYVITDERLRELIRRPVAASLAVLVVGVTAVMVYRFVAAGRRGRRGLAFPTAALLCAAVLGASGFVRAARQATGVLAESVFPMAALLALAGLFPVAVLGGLVRERLDLARVSDLVRQLSALPVSQLRPVLATALSDPRLELILADGRSAAPPDPSGSDVRTARRVTPIDSSAGPAAWLVHDRSLMSEPRLLESVRSSVAMALENARLQAELHGQLAEVRASRTRIVEAADAARRRLERDLHDGAQQRLLAIGLALQAVRHTAAEVPAETAELLAEAEAELREAITELRELARGIHPAILSEQGIGPAVQQLARRSPLPVDVTATGLARLPADLETTTYFLVSEALANVVKHANATYARIVLELDDGVLTVEVSDDGRGGAQPRAGSGLAGLADRVAALDGDLTIDSNPGDGTTLRARMPSR